MNSCQRHQETIALMAAGLCPEAEERQAKEHLETCVACRASLQELTSVAGDIRRLKNAGTQAVPGPGLRGRWQEQILSGGRAGGQGKSRGRERVARGESWSPWRHPWLVWGLSTAVCVLLAFVIGYRHGRSARLDPLENVKMIQETLAMFPHRVQAMVEDEHGVRLVLSDNDDVPASAPLYIHVCDGKHCTSFLTFSGQEITVAGQRVTVLEDAHGGVILAGNEFVWSNAERTEVGNHWQIEAKNLGGKLM